MLRICLPIACCGLLASCSKSTAPPPAPAAQPVTAPAAAPAAPAVAPAAAPAPRAAAPDAGPPRREVEAFGKLVLPPRMPLTSHLSVHFAEGDCLKPGARIVASFAAVGGSFAAELFPVSDTTLTICGALEEIPGQPVRYYGKAPGQYVVRPKDGEDDVEWRGVTIQLQKGPPIKLPTVYNPPDFPPLPTARKK